MDYRPPAPRRASGIRPLQEPLEPLPVRSSTGSWWPFLASLTLIGLVLAVLLLAVALG